MNTDSEPSLDLGPHRNAVAALREHERLTARYGSTDMETRLAKNLRVTLERAQAAEARVSEVVTQAAAVLVQGLDERQKTCDEEVREARVKRDTAVRTAQDILEEALAAEDLEAMRAVLRHGLRAMDALDCTMIPRARRHDLLNPGASPR